MCALSKLEKSWLWPFIEQFWAGLDVCEGQGRWWEASCWLGSSWDGAFLEDAPSSPRDVLVKARAALQEGVKMQKKNQFFHGNVMLSDVVVLRHHRFITIHTKLPKPATSKTLGCPIIALISPFCFGCP